MAETLDLRTDRLTLQTLDPSFAPQVLDYYVRNKAFLKEWSPAAGDAFYTLEYQRERLQAELDLMHDGRMLRLWLFRKEDAALKRVIGNVGFNNIVRGVFQSCHLGYQIDAQEGGQGLMTEAVRKAIAYIFEVWKLHRIEANIMPRNHRSRRVIEKLGFVEEGLAKKYLKINGVWEDHIHYVVFNQEDV